MRGKLSRIHPLLHFHRITPAGAGKTGRRQRTRGYYRGSPPQVRGKPRLAGSMPHGVGITPAGAGKTFSLFSFFCRYRDHPRRCGENYALIDFRIFLAGSPPQVRGKPWDLTKKSTGRRITPAGAGKTLLLLLCSLLFQDHPRRCGENVYISRICANCAGSPPQVRGKRDSVAAVNSVTRITPAGAGKTKPV